MKVQADVKKLDFSVELETKTPKTIYSDPVRLRQILINLLGTRSSSQAKVESP